ncbi:SDR family oxidoreductase [Zwartia sp.]|uniref:SDR family oxidoreductase n=1 Tax=Zwartia sp. TaxID=2978004 RepID=UPI002727C583|nr:SDR family oxidoreductase [Zwartia sp.]MDO9023357.1 SDR family oxidoreductase [Zwartia sp.]
MSPSSSGKITVSSSISSNRIALVTGAGKRLGRSIALGLAQAGWDVVVHYGRSAAEAQDTVAAIQALGRQAVALQADLADDASVETLISGCTAALGLPNCVVNNASLFDYDDASTFGTARLDAHMHVNLAAPVALARDLHRARMQSAQTFDHPAVVINLLDQKLSNPNPDFLSYTLSKAALLEATRLLAQALAPQVRVVGLAPGITLVSGDQTVEGFQDAHRMTPLGKSSTPGDIAAAVVYLASAHAITGTTLYVDGGQHLKSTERDVMFLTP